MKPKELIDLLDIVDPNYETGIHMFMYNSIIIIFNPID